MHLQPFLGSSADRASADSLGPSCPPPACPGKGGELGQRPSSQLREPRGLDLLELLQFPGLDPAQLRGNLLRLGFHNLDLQKG